MESKVEKVLYEHPAVLEAAVIGVPDPYRGETVKAFIVLKPEYRGKVTAEEIIKFCRERLAAYKVPRIIEFRDELPKSAVGKILRRVLKERSEEKVINVSQNYLPNIIILNLSAALAAEFAMYPK
jgi:long-chain acyl-CoA synthetase